MTIFEAIARTDELKSNTYDQKIKVEWLSRLDWLIKHQIIDTHQGGEAVRFAGYGQDTDLHTELLVPEPYDEIYLRWLEAQIDYHNGEIDRYNVAITMYNAAYENYTNYYARTHKPLPKGSRFLF